ncbi:MAG TPA: hypothetical protein VK955_12965 [Xanthobacteraceae bacterium]|nr:hypothetical protein [Xanthobacteraceae bacterium]
MKRGLGAVAVLVVASAVAVGAQWPKHPVAGAPRDAQGNVQMDAPTPRTADGKPDLSGVWMRAESGPPRQGGPGRQGGRGQAPGGAPGAPPPAGGPPAAAGGPPPPDGPPAAAGNGNAAFAGGRGGVQLEPPTERFPLDPNGPPVATFFEAGANMPGGLPYTPWAADVKKQRMALIQKDNPDANCLPMGFLQFHMQPQPRKIIQTPQMILIEYEANYGIRHIYTDGRTLPAQGDVQPWWYGYSVGHWDGDDLVVETNNLRGAEESVNDGWLDVNGSPYSGQAKITERFRRPTFGHLQIDMTVEDAKSYTKPWTVRVDQRILPDQELIEFVCNENQQFRRKIKID